MQFARQELCLRMRMNIETDFRPGNGHGFGEKILLTLLWKTGFAFTKIIRCVGIAAQSWTLHNPHNPGSSQSWTPTTILGTQDLRLAGLTYPNKPSP